MTQPDPIGYVRAVLLQELAVSDDPGPAVRGGRLEPGDEPPVILLEEAGALRSPTVGIYMPFRVMVTVFGPTDREASDLYRTVTDVMHRRGPEIVDGVGLWRCYDETGPQPRDDPDTRWPARFGILALYLADQTLE